MYNPYYSQCVPGTATTTVASTTTTVSTTTSAPATTTTATSPSSTGFVTVSGQNFMLNGDVYPLVG